MATIIGSRPKEPNIDTEKNNIKTSDRNTLGLMKNCYTMTNHNNVIDHPQDEQGKTGGGRGGVYDG